MDYGPLHIRCCIALSSCRSYRGAGGRSECSSKQKYAGQHPIRCVTRKTTEPSFISVLIALKGYHCCAQPRRIGCTDSSYLCCCRVVIFVFLYSTAKARSPPQEHRVQDSPIHRIRAISRPQSGVPQRRCREAIDAYGSSTYWPRLTYFLSQCIFQIPKLGRCRPADSARPLLRDSRWVLSGSGRV